MIAKNRARKKVMVRARKHSWQDKIVMAILVCLACSIVGILMVANVKLYSERKQVNNQSLDLNKEIDRVEKKNQELKELFSAASQEENSEKFLRENAMYKKKGETVVVVKREEPVLQESVNQVQENENQTASVIDKVINFFKDIFSR